MPTSRSTTIPVTLVPGQWVLLEEVWKEGFWVDNDRHMEVPPDTVVRFRHNFLWPFWVWEITLRSGTHGFHIADGWNKFQARLEPGSRGSVVGWTL